MTLTLPAPPRTATSAPALRRILPLDGLRAIAIGMVLAYHFHLPGFAGGFVGVNVFFVLSGYLITTLLLREHRTTGRIALGAFWWRRAVRLYPVLLLVVGVGIALWWLVGDYQGASLSAGSAALFALTYTGNAARSFAHISQGVFAPTWSLATEEQFYLLWPPLLIVVLGLVARRRITRGVVLIALAALVVLSCAAGWLLYSTPGGSATPDVYFNPLFNVAPLMMGCAVAIALDGERMRRAVAGRLGSVAAVLGLAGILVIQFTIGDDWKLHAHVFGVVLPAVGLFTALLIAGVATRVSVVSRILSLRPLAWFGRNVSYPLYLWHVLVFAVVTSFVSGVVGTLLAIPLAVGVAVASHLWIERPVQRLLGGWMRQRRTRRTVRTPG